jgi:hypothetical protein
MTKKPRRAKKKKPAKKSPAKKKARAEARSRRRRARIKPIVGPFQIELPLQMPLFALESSTAPAPPVDEKPATVVEARATTEKEGPTPSQAALFDSTNDP